ncbi:MAG TPA: lipase maturation factor family protein [bacterium]|nr:lipase maturation factor family protein [bacterium]
MEDSPTLAPAKPTYWLTRFMILRLLGLVYFAAFLSLVQQLRPLIGEKGLTPVPLFLSQFQAEAGSLGQAFFHLPSLFWFWHSDGFMVGAAWAGTLLSFLVLAGYANGLLLLFLWALYLSFVHIGQDWYGYGWEIQLLETGFLAIFLAPLLDGRPFPKSAPPLQVIWLFRWLIFRIMIGAGLIKMRGDPCWRDLTCLKYHYETQPIPNPLSPYLHFMPLWFHKAGALYNFLAELVAPWGLVSGRRLRTAAGCIMAFFQIILILSGNLSFLNWLTLVPILSCFDDGFWYHFLPRPLVEKANLAIYRSKESTPSRVTAWGLTALVALLSINPVTNLLSPNQAMNTSFEPLNIVNTYGAFGSVGRERLQLVFEGTTDQVLTPETIWKPYDFKCQPGNLYRRPCVCSPYQYRLDWQIWFAAMGDPSQYPWVYNLVWKLLHNDSPALSLLRGNPFPNEAPTYIRARLFRYQFAPLSHPNGQWWERAELGLWLPPLSTSDPQLQKILMTEGWL